MIQYVTRRLLTAFVTLAGITLVTFFLIQLAPGDPAQMQAAEMMNAEASERVYRELKRYYGLDKPLVVQYATWMKRLVTGDLGNSFYDGQKVSRKHPLVQGDF